MTGLSGKFTTAIGMATFSETSRYSVYCCPPSCEMKG